MDSFILYYFVILLRLDSHKFGYGLMDGGKMVDLALSWNGTAPRLRQNLASPENTSMLVLTHTIY